MSARSLADRGRRSRDQGREQPIALVIAGRSLRSVGPVRAERADRRQIAPDHWQQVRLLSDRARSLADRAPNPPTYHVGKNINIHITLGVG